MMSGSFCSAKGPELGRGVPAQRASAPPNGPNPLKEEQRAG